MDPAGRAPGPVAWLSLDAATPISGASGAPCSRRCPGDGRRCRRRLSVSRASPSGWSWCCRRSSTRSPRREEPVVLVLDDFHEVRRRGATTTSSASCAIRRPALRLVIVTPRRSAAAGSAPASATAARPRCAPPTSRSRWPRRGALLRRPRHRDAPTTSRCSAAHRGLGRGAASGGDRRCSGPPSRHALRRATSRATTPDQRLPASARCWPPVAGPARLPAAHLGRRHAERATSPTRSPATKDGQRHAGATRSEEAS